MAVYPSVIEMIGNTPMIDVSNLSPNPKVRILAKLEGQNPAGSVKDRIAWSMIREAEDDGSLTPGRTIIEPSSGNTGIALAMIAQLRGYPIKIVLPENVLDRTSATARDIRRRDHPVARRGRLQRRGAPSTATGRRTSRVAVPVPVRERGQSTSALRDDRARNPARCP
jgi:hypothetical protein